MGRSPLRLALLLIPLLFACFAIAQSARAVSPPPDGGYPGGNTAEGDLALGSLTTGIYNTAVGIYSLLSLTDGNPLAAAGGYCTAVGAGALMVNADSDNTATGAGALFANTNGGDNTANGAFALFTNTTGDINTAIGSQALFANTTGGANTAVGNTALKNNATGGSNTAIGEFALGNNTTGNGNLALGSAAGSVSGLGDGNIFIASIGESGDSNTIRIGTGLQTATFIDGITGVDVTGDPVVVDADGQLGVAPTGSPLSKNELLKQQHLVQEQEATIAQLKKDFGATVAQLTARLNEQASQIQKVSAQLEASKPAPRVVNNP